VFKKTIVKSRPFMDRLSFMIQLISISAQINHSKYLQYVHKKMKNDTILWRFLNNASLTTCLCY